MNEIRHSRLSWGRPVLGAGNRDAGGRRSSGSACAGCRRARSVARWCRSARTGSSGRAGTGTRWSATRSSAPTRSTASTWEDYLGAVRKAGSSAGAVIEVVADGVPPGLGAPIYGKLDADLAGALMSINAVKGVEIGAGFAAAALGGEANADEMRDGRRAGGVRLQSGRRHLGRHFDRTARGRPLRRQADQLDPHSAPLGGSDRPGGRGVTTGRHDPCVGIRAVPVGEAMLACVLADHLLRHRAQNPDAPDTARLPRN